MSLLLTELRKTRHAAVDRPRAASSAGGTGRHAAAVVKRAEGGATTAENLELRCRAHNAYESERWFGVSEDLAREARERATRSGLERVG